MKIASLLLPLALAACSAGPESPAPDEASPSDGLWMADDRSGLCQAGPDAAFIFYAEDGSNCMAQGSIEARGDDLFFIPRGDRQCAVPIGREGDTLTIGAGGEDCAYYCGGTARLPGPPMRRSTGGMGALVDAAGEAICPS